MTMRMDSMPKMESSEFWNDPTIVHRRVAAAAAGQSIDLLTPPVGALIVSGPAVVKLRTFLAAAAEGSNAGIRLYGWDAPRVIASPAGATPGEQYQPMGELLADLTLGFSGAFAEAVHPITQEATAGKRWYSASQEVAVAHKYALGGVKPCPDPWETPSYHPGNLVNEVQTVTMGATGGTWSASFNGQSTGSLAYNITTANLQTALEGLSTVGAGNVTVTGTAGASYVITFKGALGGWDQPMISLGTGSLTGGTATIAETTKGVQGRQLIYLVDVLAGFSLWVEPYGMPGGSEMIIAIKRVQ